MKAAILQCDKVPDELRLEFACYSDMIAGMLLRFDPSFGLTTFDCQQSDFPDDLDAYDFYITTGSRTDAYVSLPWVDQLKEFIHRLDAHKKKLIGICFGHQIIAETLGGKVENSSKGWGVGVAKNRVVAKPDWMSDHKADLNIIVSHQDQVIRLTDNALLIAESDFCPYFVVQWNNRFLSIQGHPEWQVDYSRALMELRRGLVPDERIEQGLKTLDIVPDNELFMRWVMDFIHY